MEGENAAFFVEVEQDEMDICWFKDGLQLQETHQTIVKSFGKTHILVFVNTSYQDSGTITFMAGRSTTSSKLRVKSEKTLHNSKTLLLHKKIFLNIVWAYYLEYDIFLFI